MLGSTVSPFHHLIPSHASTIPAIRTAPIRTSLSSNHHIASRAFSPYIPISSASSPNLRLLPSNPAIMNGFIFISPIPAAHPNTLYGIGENAAINVPTVPYLMVRASIFSRCLSALKRLNRDLPHFFPSQ